MTGGLQGIVFDFDGVIADSEPLHLRAYQDVLAEIGITLTRQEYFSRYLGYDDLGMLESLAVDREVSFDATRLADLIARKGVRLQEILRAGEVLFPGAADFVRQAAEVVPIAIASGAQRHEIEEIIEASGLADLFSAIVAAGETPEGKPSPDPYKRAFEMLNAKAGGRLDGRRTVAIEDSRWGLESAAGAGLRCVGVTNSYPASELPGAELIVDGLKALTLPMLDRLVSAERSSAVRA